MNWNQSYAIIYQCYHTKINRINSLFGILFTYHLVSTINFVIFCSKNFWEFVVILRHNVINKYILFYTTSWWLFFPVIGGDLRKMIRLLPTAMVCNLLYLRQLIVWFLHEEIISTLNFKTSKYQTYTIFSPGGLSYLYSSD